MKEKSKDKKIIKAIINIFVFIICLIIICAAYLAYFYFTKQEIKPQFVSDVIKLVDKDGKFLSNFGKKEESDKEDKTIATEPIYRTDNYPKVDGSTATIPLAQAYQADFTGKEFDDVEINHSKTHNAYVKLINKEVDLILVTYPSDEERDLAKRNNIELAVDKVVNEGFVFFVNKNNPVDSLTVEQIQKIYSGEITNWKEVGGNDEKIVAYQRPKNSGSQTGMEELVMKNKKLAEAPKENVATSMSDIIDVISNYTNSSAAIGYSYYFYANSMYTSDSIKMIKVNDVEPNNETIKAGNYPFLTAYYAVTRNDKTEIADTLKSHMLSDRGQQVAEKAGYVPIR